MHEDYGGSGELDLACPVDLLVRSEHLVGLMVQFL
jgi:hypothetical protein